MTDAPAQQCQPNKDDALPLCAICGANVKDPCTTDKQSKTCELPEFCWPNRISAALLLALADRFEADARVHCYTLIKVEHSAIAAALRRAAQPADDVRERTIEECAEIARGMKMAAAHANVFGRLSEAYGAVEVSIRAVLQPKGAAV